MKIVNGIKRSWLPVSRPLFVLVLAATALPACGQFQYPFQNPDLPVEDRVTNIVSLMSLEEKVAFLSSRPGVPRLGIPAMGHSEGLHGLAQGGPSNWGRRNPHPTTSFPQAYGMAETWDPELMRQAGAVEGYEARYMVQSEALHRGGLIVRAPNADLGRDPRWGRTEECYGEDPFFNGTMAAAFVRGLQGDNPKYWLTASLLKHFFANSNEDERDRSSSDFDEALFREYYSVPFRMGIEEGGARCFMTSYNEWNHVPCTVQPVIREVAMREWGADGIICTDGGASANLTNVNRQHYYTNSLEAAAGEIKAGINQFLDRSSPGDVGQALQARLLSETELDDAIKGTLRVFIRLGLMDPTNTAPYASIGSAGEPEPWTTAAHEAVARRVTQESIVLLKNSKRLLPLDRTRLKSVAVVGPLADEVLLDWYSGTPPYRVTPLEGIRAGAGAGVAVTSATTNVEAAIQLARAADVAVVCVGNNPIGVPDAKWGKVSVPSEGKEAVDRQSITLEQEDLIRRIYAANPRTIVVLISSFPYAINWTEKHVPAIIHMTHCSEELGNALANVLFGDFNPAGRLVQTWPKSLAQLPPMMDYDIRHGRTYMYFKGTPLYPFGFGLSYTTFEYSGLKTSAPALARDGSIDVSVDVKNSGDRAGEEVVQLYVRHLKSVVKRPAEELRGFRRVALQPGETKSVQLPLPAKSLAYWDSGKQAWTVEPGRIEIAVGASSADRRLSRVLEVR
jgi:beta-glucosidase